MLASPDAFAGLACVPPLVSILTHANGARIYHKAEKERDALEAVYKDQAQETTKTHAIYPPSHTFCQPLGPLTRLSFLPSHSTRTFPSSRLADVIAKNQIETLEQLCAYFEEYKKFFSLGYKRVIQLQSAVKVELVLFHSSSPIVLLRISFAGRLLARSAFARN
jgi:hypothetical protein